MPRWGRAATSLFIGRLLASLMASARFGLASSRRRVRRRVYRGVDVVKDRNFSNGLAKGLRQTGLHLIVGSRQRHRDTVSRQGLHHLAENGHAGEINVGDRHRVHDEVLRLRMLRQELVKFASKDPRIREKNVVVKEHAQYVLDRRDVFLAQRLPTRRSFAPAHLNHVWTRRSPGLIENRETDRDREALLDADQDDAQSGNRGEEKLHPPRTPDPGQLTDLDESRPDEEQDARQSG